MYGCKSWTIKAEHQRIDAFKRCHWRRLLTFPWNVGRSNQSILKEINPENSLKGLMLKLKLQYFGHLMQRVDSLEKTLMLGKIEDRRRRGWQRIRWHHRLDGHEFEQAPGVGEGHGSLARCSPWGPKELDITEWRNNNKGLLLLFFFLMWTVFYVFIEICYNTASALCFVFLTMRNVGSLFPDHGLKIHPCTGR